MRMASAAATQSQRLFAFVTLALSEIFLASLVFNFPTMLPEWANPVAYVKGLAQSISLAALVFFLIAGHKRGKIMRLWSYFARIEDWRPNVLTNLTLFALLVAATMALSSLALSSPHPPWNWFALYCCLLFTTALSLAAVAAPRGFWKALCSIAPSEIAIALMAGGLLVLAGRLSLEGWATMSSATLRGSHWILTLYETDVVLDTNQRILGVGNFSVKILKECSGYEGTGLVAAFLSLYCWFMRGQLRFPHALALIPAGIAAVWILNLFRIAALVSIGHHISSDLALNGFHSQAGWIGFLLVAVGAMAASQAKFLRRRQPSPVAPADLSDDRLLLAYLVPFMVLTATSIPGSFFAQDQLFYLVKVFALATAVWSFRNAYLSLPFAVSPLSVIIGAAIGVAWIATEAHGETTPALGAWLAMQPAWLAAAWLICRILGGVLLVPLAEELAFRGYLQRALIARTFLSVAPGRLTCLSFVGTSLLFGLIHQRWVAAALAGALYALMLHRSNRLSDAIAAHAASNAVIIGWAIFAQRWSLL